MAPESDWIHLHILRTGVYDGLSPLESNEYLPNYEPIQHSLVVTKRGTLFYVLIE
jgi:hypothetical protein